MLASVTPEKVAVSAVNRKSAQWRPHSRAVGLAARLTGSRLAAVLPALVWLVVAVGGSLQRPEGDLLVTGSGALGLVSLAFLMAGVVAAAFAVGKVLAAPRDGVRPVRTGSGSGGAR